MSINFDISTPDSAYMFLIELLGMRTELFTEYTYTCDANPDIFWERNYYRLDKLDINDIHFIIFHVTGSLDSCTELKKIGIRNLQYVLSHDTLLSRLLSENNIFFDVDHHKLIIDNHEFVINYDYYRTLDSLDEKEKLLAGISHRIYYDYRVNGFFMNDAIQDYGTDIHKRPEFLAKLIKLSPKAKKLDSQWQKNSTPYKIFFYAHADQLEKSTFGLKDNNQPYTEIEQSVIKKWILNVALKRAFEPPNFHNEIYAYVRNDEYIPPEQIRSCKIIDL